MISATLSTKTCQMRLSPGSITMVGAWGWLGFVWSVVWCKLICYYGDYFWFLIFVTWYSPWWPNRPKVGVRFRPNKFWNWALNMPRQTYRVTFAVLYFGLLVCLFDIDDGPCLLNFMHFMVYLYRGYIQMDAYLQIPRWSRFHSQWWSRSNVRIHSGSQDMRLSQRRPL